MELHNINSSGVENKELGEFVEAGWNQEPLSLLREIWSIADGWYGQEKADAIKKRGAMWTWRDDMSSGSVGILQIPEIDGIEIQGYIVATWYKSRGTTDVPQVIFDGSAPERLRVADCYKIADYYLKEIPLEK